ncbi:MAG: type II toxin-antitoxin system Xre/ParS family antitoxin [Akkermansiaceae bacterium]
MRGENLSLAEIYLPASEQPGVLEEPKAPYDETPMVTRIREGFPVQEFTTLQKLLDIPEDELGLLIGISPATLQRRKKAGNFERPESDKLVCLYRVFGKAMELFEEESTTRDWLKTENPGTAGESPLRYADTEYGAKEVEALVTRIEHGVY